MTPPNNTIINVALDDAGNISFQISPCVLDTKQYGRIFATLIRQVGAMFETESRGTLPAHFVVEQIAAEVGVELDNPTAETSMSLTQ